MTAEAQLLSFMKDSEHYVYTSDHAATKALLIFSYCALFFSCSATLSALMLTDEFGELPLRASQKEGLLKDGTYFASTSDLLELYGARPSWKWVMWHCEHFFRCTLTGCTKLKLAATRLFLSLGDYHMYDNSTPALHLVARVERD